MEEAKSEDLRGRRQFYMEMRMCQIRNLKAFWIPNNHSRFL